MCPQGVVVTAAAPLTREIAGARQLGHDAVRGALRDPNLLAEVAQPDRGILRDCDEDPRVVGEEAPVGQRLVREAVGWTRMLDLEF